MRRPDNTGTPVTSARPFERTLLKRGSKMRTSAGGPMTPASQPRWYSPTGRSVSPAASSGLTVSLQPVRK